MVSVSVQVLINICNTDYQQCTERVIVSQATVQGFWVQLDLENIHKSDILISLKVFTPEEKNLALQPSGIS